MEKQRSLGQNVEIVEQGLKNLDQLSNSGILGKILKNPINISTNYQISTVFDVNTSKGRQIVKFRKDGCASEAFAYDKWKSEGVFVPDVVASGQLSDSMSGYIITKPILNTAENLARTGIAIPIEKRFAIEKFMGKELAKMHHCKIERFGASPHDAQYKHFSSWNSYVEDELRTLKLRISNELGLERAQIKLIYQLADRQYSSQAVLSHGDFGVHNILVPNLRPFRGIVLDPNLIAADPYYDIAYYLNLKEAWGRKKIIPNSDIFLGSYFKNDFGDIDLNQLSALRAFTAIYRFFSTIDRKEYSRAKIYKAILLEQLALAKS